ncbi:MAG: nucleoside-triphosphatase [Eubacteriales bacterium]|nr:nucleoside-triphosphatase [Eubacteriales bacterium]
MHALIVGANGTGKTTLIRRVLQALQKPVAGFETVKEDALADAQGSPIYIYEAGKPHRQTPENLVGYCRDRKASAVLEGFDRFARQFSEPTDADCVIEMDEIGFLETRSQLFCDRILTLLDGSRPVLAAVRDKDTPFLRSVRAHPNARCFYITPENREALFREVLDFMRSQLEDLP